MGTNLLENGGIRIRHLPNCPLCASPGRVRYSDLGDRSWDAPGKWSFRECTRCVHLWLDPAPIVEDIGRLYASYYTHGEERPSPLRGAGFWPMCRRGVLEAYGYDGIAQDSRERLLGRLAAFMPPVWEECEEIVHSVPGPARGVLLDVGCGDGSFLRLMRDLGWMVQGVEPDPKAAAGARASGLDVVEDLIERAALAPDAFDVITMSHVIEHVPDPIAVFERTRHALKPGGTMFIFTPNSESLGHALFGRSWYSLEPPRHLHIFRAENLIACAERAGLEVKCLRTSGRLHLIFDASVRIRKTGRYGFGDPTVQASISDRLFRIAETFLVRSGARRGEELIMICTKRSSG